MTGRHAFDWNHFKAALEGHRPMVAAMHVGSSEFFRVGESTTVSPGGPYRLLCATQSHEHGVSGVSGADSYPQCRNHAVWLVDHGDKWACERCGEKFS